MQPDTPRKLVLNKTTLRDLAAGRSTKTGQLGTGVCSDPTTTTEP